MLTENLKKSSRCSHKKICIGIFTFLGLLFLFVGIITFLFFGKVLDTIIKSKIPLKEGNEMTLAWLSPPLKPLLQIYFFNVTNPDGFLKGEKPRLVEVGPFVYEEKWHKLNVTWLNNGTEVEYVPTKTYFFRKDLSVGPESQVLMLPNIPMIFALISQKDSDLFLKSALGAMLEILKQEIFEPLTVSDILWGYEHPLVKLAKEVLPLQKRFPFDEFGFFVGKNASTIQGLFRAKTGINNLNETGQLISFNGNEKLNYWKEGSCNEIRGSDGSLFHPDLSYNETVYIFAKDLCHSIPLIFDSEVYLDGLPAYRFVPRPDLFNHSDRDPSKDCFCMAEEGCQNFPAGLFNMSACQLGSPIMISWPHFFQGDRVLIDAVEGLNPDKEKHQFFIDIQPTLGITMRAGVKTQINIAMKESPEMPQAEGLRDLIFPVLWISEGIDENSSQGTIETLKKAVLVPELLKNVLYTSCFAIGSLMLLSVGIYLAFRILNREEKESGKI